MLEYIFIGWLLGSLDSSGKVRIKAIQQFGLMVTGGNDLIVLNI